MLAGKNLTDFTNLFSPHDFTKNDIIFVLFQKWMKVILLKQLTNTDLSEQTKFWLDEISKTENYFIEEINQRKSCSKKISKYVAGFDYLFV